MKNHCTLPVPIPRRPPADFLSVHDPWSLAVHTTNPHRRWRDVLYSQVKNFFLAHYDFLQVCAILLHALGPKMGADAQLVFVPPDKVHQPWAAAPGATGLTLTRTLDPTLAALLALALARVCVGRPTISGGGRTAPSGPPSRAALPFHMSNGLPRQDDTPRLLPTAHEAAAAAAAAVAVAVAMVAVAMVAATVVVWRPFRAAPIGPHRFSMCHVRSSLSRAITPSTAVASSAVP
jgi:hypothetical protein